jgi:hypothetical protein
MQFDRVGGSAEQSARTFGIWLESLSPHSLWRLPDICFGGVRGACTFYSIQLMGGTYGSSGGPAFRAGHLSRAFYSPYRFLIYLKGRKWLPSEKPINRNRRGSTGQPLLPGERRRLIVMLALLPVLGAALVGNFQVFNAYLLWAENNYDLTVLGWAMPVTWLLSVGSVIVLASIAGSVIFWRWWARHRREPSEITKMTLGAFMLACAPLAPALCSYFVAGTGHKASLVWAVVYEVINDIGYANFLPVGLALYSRSAPKAIGGTMTGVYYVLLFFTNMLVGWLGGFLERVPGTRFWMLHVLYLWGQRIDLSSAVRGLYAPLIQVRDRLETKIRIFRTEPDIMLVVQGEMIICIEAKFGSGNTLAHGISEEDKDQQKPTSRQGLLTRYLGGNTSEQTRAMIQQDKIGSVFHSQLFRNIVFAAEMAASVSWHVANLVSSTQCSAKRKEDHSFADPAAMVQVQPAQRECFTWRTWENLYAAQIRGRPDLSGLDRYFHAKSAHYRPAFNLA